MNSPKSHSTFRVVMVAGLLVSLLMSPVLFPATPVYAATFTVNSTLDRTDISPGDGVCRTATAGQCTLRAAIQEANALPGADIINLPAGVYELQLSGVNEDLDTTNDFDIRAPVTIVGAGASATYIDGGVPGAGAEPTARGIDRLLEIHPNTGNVTIRDLTLREGYTSGDGAAILNWSSGLLRLENVTVRDNLANGAGGGIQNDDPASYTWATAPQYPPPSGRVEIVNSIFTGNAGGGGGSAINNTSDGTISILAGSQIVDNPGPMIPDPLDPTGLIPAPGVYEPGGSAIVNESSGDSPGTLRIADSTVARNYSTQNGGGVANEGSGVLIIERAIITNNTSEAGGGGIHTNGGTVTINDSTLSGNHAHDGGGIDNNGAADSIGLRPRFSLVNSTIISNTSEAGGGGMTSGGDSQLTITDSRFEANTAGDEGGGLSNGGRASMTLIRVTFHNNTAHGEGGGAWTGASRLTTIHDSTFTFNDAGVPTAEEIADPAGANLAGGGGLFTENGPAIIAGSTFANNTATAEGGGISIDNFGEVTLSESVIRDNRAGEDGGGIENSGTRVAFTELLISGNWAGVDGGGIHNSSSGPFQILDSTIQQNSAINGGGIGNAPDNALIMRRSLVVGNIARNPGLNDDGTPADGGLGGGFYSLADGDSLIENSTVSANTAAVAGGGIFHDADGELKLVQLTIWRNSAPQGGGIGVAESDFVPTNPPSANVSVIARNTIVGGSTQGGSCDYYITSEGGNIDTGGTQVVDPASGSGLPTSTACFLSSALIEGEPQAGRDRFLPTYAIDAIANNGGLNLTHAIDDGNVAIANGIGPCVSTDQRGVNRPETGACTSGAYEYLGAPLPPDYDPPDTLYVSGPVQDSLETLAFTFVGTDTVTPPALLQYECRLMAFDPASPPEPRAPWEPIPPEEQFVSCTSPWRVGLLGEEGTHTFEVRAIDLGNNVDPTPATHTFSGSDTEPPETIIAEKPPLLSGSRSATFSFVGTDNLTPPQFLEFECRLDSNDPDLWLECTNPTIFSNLTSGQHTMEVRALDGAEQIDPTPARYTWTIGQLPTCDAANITLTAAADGWVDEVNPSENYLFMSELSVRSAVLGDPTAVPPEPTFGQNARALYRFALPTDASNCVLEAATLRLYNESPSAGRTLLATPLGASWLESTLTWYSQPPTLTGAVPVAVESGEGYQEWNVTTHVQAMLDSGLNHGWQIRDANENDPDGGDQAFVSREMPQDPPPATLPVLVLRYTADGGPPPQPPTPTLTETIAYCGQVITQSILLGNDLIGCLGEGLAAGASNIVIDLNGHTLTSGINVAAGQETGLPAGVRVSGHSNVVVRNGTVRGFGYGVLLTGGTTRNVVEHMTLDANLLAGIELNDADDGRTGNILRHNLLTANGEAAISLINGSENSLIISNTLDGNGGVGFQLVEADGHRFEANDVRGRPLSPLVDSDAGGQLEGSSDNVFINNTFTDFGDAGLILQAGSRRNRIENNVFVRSGDAGVNVQDSDGTQIINNVAHQSSDGGVVVSGGNNTVIRGNDLRFNPNGVDTSNANNLTIENNDGSDSLQAGFEIGNGLNIVLRNNTANRTGGSGIAMETGAFDANGNPVGGALIEGNTANDNRENGIVVADGGHTIRNNTAHNNAGFGITAGEAPEPGQAFTGSNIDGGGNIASGNREVSNCVGVVCADGGAPPPAPPDTTTPETLVMSGPYSPTNETSATFVFSATDNTTPLTGMVFECRLDPGPDPLPEPEPPPDPEPPDPNAPPDPPEPPETLGWGECVSPRTYTGLQLGMHRFQVRAMDQAEPPNRDQTPATFVWMIDPTAQGPDLELDSIPPSTRIASAPAAETASTTAIFSFAGSDNQTPGLNLSFECQLDGQGFGPCTTPQTYPGLSVGPHTFEVRAVDRRLNTDATPAIHQWTIVTVQGDTTPPETTITSGPDPVTVLTHAAFAFSSDDSSATFECSIDGGTTYAACTSPRAYTGLAVGPRNFRVRARDGVGNVDPTPASFNWTIAAGPVPTTVFCGQVVMQSILVQNDLNDCLWDGLVVGAPNITIDLNGHLIDGKGLAAGIRVDGHDGVTIRNGRVEDFDYGVMLNPGTEGAIVEAMRMERNQDAGIGLGVVPHSTDPLQPLPLAPPPTYQSGVNNNILRNNTIVANNAGILLTNGTRNTLVINNDLGANAKEGIEIERASANRIESNDINGSSGAAVGLVGASNNVVLNNTITDNGAAIAIGATDSSSGNIPSNNNRVENNFIEDSGNTGIEIADSDGNHVIANIVQGANGEGVSLYHANNSVVRGNDLRGNKSGVDLKNSANNLIEGNDTSNSEGMGISVASLSPNNIISANISGNNDSAGIYIGDETSGDAGTWVEGNTTNNNTGYGIHVSKVSHTLKRNIANYNSSWGIYVSEGSNGRTNIDGGGNRALGNIGPLDPYTQQPLQCYSIICDGGPVVSDDIPPDTLILEGPPNPSTDVVATFYFNGSDNNGSVTFECKVDAGNFAPCAAPASFTLAVGTHTFEVRAVDNTGNADPTPASHSWTILALPPGAPETAIASGPDLTTISTGATFVFTSSERNSTFECALDAGAFALCTTPRTYTGLAVGNHTFRVRAIDPDSDVDLTPATYAWTITAAPVPAVVGCGEVIVQSTRVLNDLFDCGGHGLIIGANNVTLDLDGHTIDGTGLDAGILNNGYDSVTIMNGTLTDFDYGVLLNPGTSLNVLSALRLESNQIAGIALSDADQAGRGNTIRDNTFATNALGLIIASNTRFTLVRNNAFGANTAEGIRIEFSSEARIENNEITGSGGSGIEMVSGGNNVVIANTLTNNTGYGIVVGEELLPSNNNLIERNTISGGQGGIGINDSTGNQVLFNTASGSTGPGVLLDLARTTLVRGNDLRGNASGIALSEASDNYIEANNASGGSGTGIEVGALSNNNVVVQNTASNNGGDGLTIEDAAPVGAGNLLDRNTADGNGGDGVAVHGVGHTLVGNSAQRNGGWGIYVATGGTDGGGNFAAGNIEPAQCFGVACTIGTVSGAPDTVITSGPSNPSSSRNASFTYTGSDSVTPLQELVFECRIDSTNPLDWEDCEYPAEFLNLSPGSHTVEIRAVDQQGAGLADQTPASYTWVYAPLAAGVAPTVTIELSPSLQTWQLDALFTFRASEPDVTLECRVDQTGYQPCGFEGAGLTSQGAFEHSLAETEVGLHTFYVRATDFEGNVGTPTTYTWRLLGVVAVFLGGPGFAPPETPGDPPTGGPVQSSTAVITFTANVADATFQCSLDLAPFAPCTSPVNYAGLLVGGHELRVIATDTQGNTQQEASVYEWEIVDLVDVAPPNTSIERAPANNSSTTLFEFTGVDNVTPPPLLTFECRVDSTNNLDWAACTSPFNLLSLYTYASPQMAPGQHVFEVRAIDAAEQLTSTAPQDGNPDPFPAVYTWTMVADTLPPGTAILDGPAEGSVTGAASVEFAFFGNDNATPLLALTYQCAVNAGPFEACASPEAVTGLAPGTHTFRVRAVDLAGNLDTTPATRTWTLVAPPTTTITSGPAGRIVDGVPPATPSTSQSAIFVFTANQPGSTFECALDGADFLPCTSPQAYWIVTDGTHEFAVRAINPQGVIEEPPLEYAWASELGSDTTRPDTTITTRPPNPSPNTVATFSFTGTDNRTAPATLSFECALNGTAYNSCVSPQQFSDLTRRVHTMLIRAKDAAGNFDATPAVYTWTVDPPPVTTILSGPDEQTESLTATFTFASDVSGSTFQCWLDGPTGPCTSPVTFTNLAGGEHIFAVLATTPAGVTGTAWTEYEWIIGDLTPPLTFITSGPGSSTESLSATFVFSSAEPGVTFACAIDGGTPLPCTSPKEYPQVQPGPHTFSVIATALPLLDRFGQPVEPLYDPVPTTYAWTVVDLQAPDTTIEFGPPLTATSTTATFGFSSEDPTALIECALDGAGFAECETPTEFTGLALGTHTLLARAVDGVGNVDATPAAYTWTIAALPPNTFIGTNVTVTISMPNGSGPNGIGNAVVSFGSVTANGATSIDILNGAPPLTGGFVLGGGSFFDINTTAQFAEPVSVCLAYNPAAFGGGAARLLHFDGSEWIDITTTSDLLNGQVCGAPEGFSPFAIVSGVGLGPLASITSGPTNPSNSGTAVFTFAADPPGAQTLCSLDGNPAVQCTSPITYTFLEAGDHEFQVQAIDFDGQAQIVPSLYEWVVTLPPDTTPPDTVIITGPPALTANAINVFNFGGSDDQTIPTELDFECALDGGAFESCSTPEEIEVLAAGLHTLTVRAVDLAGNVDTTPATRTWTLIDLSAPDTSIDAGPNSESVTTTAIFAFTGEEPDGTPVFQFECALDAADFSACTSPFTVTGLLSGSHVLQVRAVDLAGVLDPTPDFHEWLILGTADTAPPDTVIAAGPPSGNSGPDVIFGFNSNEPAASYECALDVGAFTECEPVHQLVNLASGTHVLRVRATDLAGNVDPTPATYTWMTLGEPDTTILSGPPNPSASFSASFIFTTTQAGATFQCSIDGSAFIACTSPYIAGPLIEDTHEFQVRAVNQFVTAEGVQVVDQTPATFEWEIRDITPPETIIVTATLLGPTDLVSPDSWRFEFTGSDNRTALIDLSFECALDSGAWEGCEALYYLPLEGLAGGSHTLQVRAVDELDNADATPASFTFVNEQEPGTTVLSGPPAQVDSAEATFAFTSTQVGVTFECSLDAAPYALCATTISPTVTFTNVPSGTHELLVRARSPLGSIADLTPAEYAWASGDLTPPVVTIMAGPLTGTLSTTAVFTFTADDPAALFLCSLDGALPAFCTSPVTYANLLGGEHTFEVEATKSNLLVEGVPAVYEWTVGDQIAPETTISAAPALTIALGTPAVFTFASNEPDASFECSLNGAAFADCAGAPPDNTASFSEPAGAYTLLVRAIDPSLNVDATPVTATWAVLAPPDTAIIGPASPSLSAEATFTFTDQAGSTFECGLDGAAFAPCTSPLTVTGLADGNHILRVRATNVLGVVESSPAEFAWTVTVPDTTAPDTTITSGPPVTTASTSATFVFSATEPDTTFTCVLDGGAAQGCSSPYAINSLTVATHTLLVQATDAAGNTDPTPASYEWTVVPPPPPNTLVGSNVTISFALSSGNAVLTFSTVTAAGTTSVDATTSAPLLPAGYMQVGAVYYNIATTAAFAGPVAICLSYNPLTTVPPARLLHYEGGAWSDITISDDSVAGQVCGAASSLSPFAIASGTAAVVPETTIVSGPPATTVSTSAIFEFTSNDPAATFECALDASGSWGSCVASSTFNGLAVGSHSLQVRAKNASGAYDASPASYAWTVLPVPETVILTGPTDPTESTSASFTFSSTDPAATFECALDEATFYSACISGVTYTGLALGEHDFFVRARDAAGNVDPTPDDFSWEIGNIPAPVTVTSGPAPSTDSTTATFAFTADEVNSAFACALDGGAFAPCLSPQTYTGLIIGTHTFQVQVFDLNAVADAPTTVYTWTVVAGPTATPTTTPTETPVPATATPIPTNTPVPPTATPTPTPTDTPVPPSATPIPTNTPVPPTATPTPTPTNTPVPPTATATPGDTTPPDTGITSQPAATTSSTGATFTFNATEAGSSFQCALDGAAFAACSSPTSYTGLGVGTHTFAVRAVDAMGNIDPVPSTVTWTVTAPATCSTTPVTVGANADAWLEQNSPSNNKGTDSILKVRSKGPTDNFRALVRFALPTSMPPGCTLQTATLRLFAASSSTNRTLQAWRLNGAWTENGVNWSNQPATTGTAVTVSSGNGYRQWNVTTQVQAMFASGVNNGFLIRDATENNNGAEQQLHSREKGQNLPQLVLVYAAVDTTPPNTNFTGSGQPANPTTSTSATFTFSATEAGSTYACSLDGAAFATCSSPVSLSGLAVGSHSFSVRAIDAAGNIDPSPATHTWVVQALATATFTPSPTAVPTATPTPTTAPTNTPVLPTETPTPTSSPLPTESPTPLIETPTPTSSPLPTESPTPLIETPTSTSSPLPTESPTPLIETPTSTSSPLPTESPTPLIETPTSTSTLTPVPTESPIPTDTPLATPAPTETPVPPTETPTPIPTDTAVPPTDTPAPPPTQTPIPTATTPVCTPTTVTVGVDADAWVDQNSAGNNFGSDSILKVQSKGPNNNFRALMRFVLPAVPQGCVVQSAAMQVYAASVASGRTLEAWQVAGGWAEGGVNWGNQPATIGAPATLVTSGSGYLEWNVTTQVQAMAVSGNNGFLIRDAVEEESGAEQQLHSREKGENLPMLVITFGPPPGG